MVFSTVGDIIFRNLSIVERYHDTVGDILSTVGDIMSTVRDILSTVGDIMMHMGDIMSTVWCSVLWGISSFGI